MVVSDTVGGGGNTPDPDRLTAGGAVALEATVSDPCFAPVEVGLKLTPIEQVDDGATGAEQLLVMTNDDASVPLADTPDTTRFALPGFLTVIVCGALASTIT
jgi:hypothetical protein